MSDVPNDNEVLMDNRLAAPRITLPRWRRSLRLDVVLFLILLLLVFCGLAAGAR